jgi:hypothetical protein
MKVEAVMAHESENTPDWIKRHNQQAADERERAAESTQLRQAAGAVIRQRGSDFWSRFGKSAASNARALRQLEGEDLAGYCSLEEASQARNSVEHCCHLQVNRESARFGPELSQMNLWYTPGGNRIRCWYQHKDFGDIEFVARGNEVYAVFADRTFTAEQLGEYLVRFMAERVKAKRQRIAS